MSSSRWFVFGLVCLAGCCLAATHPSPAGADSLAVTDADWHGVVRQSPEPVLADFWAPWCGPCKALSPVIEELADERPHSVRVVKIDVDANPRIAGEYKVYGVPAIKLLAQGRVLGSLYGIPEKQEILEFIEENLRSLQMGAEGAAELAGRP